jgi:hypothetical protein
VQAWGYDIFYPCLTEARRKAVRERLDLEAQWLWVATRTFVKGTERGWWSSSRGNNWHAVASGGLGFAALSLLGESASAESWLDEAVTQMKMLMDHGFDSDGAYFESPMYHRYAMEYLVFAAEALRRAGREDLFQYRNQLLRKTCLYNLYMMEPTRDSFAPFNDGWRLAEQRALHPAQSYLLCAATVYHDGLIAWLFDAVYGPQRRFPVWNTAHGHPDAILWYNTRLPRENPDTSPRLTLGRYWPEHGRVALRTSWTDLNGILFAMECGEYGSHGHDDQGGFVLTAFGEHLVDDQGYGGWEVTSEAHSVPLVDGQGQRREGMLGAVRDFLHTDAMDFFEADSTPAYALEKSPARFVLRNVLFMRPGYFVIVDRLRKDAAPHEYQWLLQGPTYNQAAKIRIDRPDAVTFLATKASLDVRLLAPRGLRAEAVPKHNHLFLRATPNQRRPEETFLAVLTPMPLGRTAPAVERIEADSLIGCAVGEDLVLWNKAQGPWTYKHVKTDAELAACRTAPVCALAKRATFLESPGLGFRADQPLTAILTESEARLVCSVPVSIAFAPGYLAEATVYVTHQDRDAANDIQVGKVDVQGKVSLPVGAFTVRK